jgi:hypothetical protein
VALVFPLSFPTTKTPRRVTFRAHSVVGVSASPLTLEQETFVWQGEGWAADIEAPPMGLADAEAYIAFLLALNGREGTFLMGQAGYAGARGTWISPVLSGAHATGVKTLNIRNVDGRTWKVGDWLQIGSGSSSRLHKVVQDGAQSGSPSVASVEIWPRTRTSYSDGQALTLSSPKGVWRLASNTREWSIDLAITYGIRFSCLEALGG